MTATATNGDLGEAQQFVSLSQQSLEPRLLRDRILSSCFYRDLAGFNYYDAGVGSARVGVEAKAMMLHPPPTCAPL